MIRAALAGLAVIAALVGAVTPAHAQRNRMGEVATVEPGATPPLIQLVTFGRGELIFEKFGHTALCLDFREPGRDTVCFNYGVTEFGTGGGALIWNFIRGRQQFWVEPVPLSGMFAFYRREDRTIWVQDLPFSPEQARAVEAKLLHDLAPENRYYYYDHFTDNCTTRLRDIVDQAAGGTLRANSDGPYTSTFRQMGRRGLAELPPIIALGDFAVGRTLDVYPTMYEAMFHPYILMDEVEKRMGVAPTLVYERKGPPIPDDGPTGRGWALAIGLLLAAPLLITKVLGRGERAAVAFITIPLTLMGLLIWGMAVLSTIPGFRWNEAVFLYVPFDAVLPFLGEHRRRQYARVRLAMVLGVSLLRGVGLFLQPLWIPIVVGFVIFGLIGFGLPNPPVGRRAARA